MAKSPPLQVVVEPELRKRIIAVAAAEDLSQAHVVRDILEAGIKARERLCEKRTLR